jgi:hypothetical protein
MKSKASSKFWKAYNGLPITIQSIAVKQYNLWLENPGHPSLQFKKVQKISGPAELQTPIEPSLLWMEIQPFGFGLDLMPNTSFCFAGSSPN